MPELIEAIQKELPEPIVDSTPESEEEAKREVVMGYMSMGGAAGLAHHAAKAAPHREYLVAWKDQQRALRLFPEICKRHFDNPQLYQILLRFVEDPGFIQDLWPGLFHELVIRGEKLGFQMREKWHYYSEIYWDTNTDDGPEGDFAGAGVP